MRLPIYEHEHSRRVLPIFGQLGRIKNFNLLIFVQASNCMHTHTRGTKNCEERELKINSNYARSSGFDDPVSWNDSRFRGEGKGGKGGGIIGATVDDIFWHLRTLFARDTVNGAITSNCVENAWPSTIEPDYCAFQQLSVHVSDRCRRLSFAYTRVLVLLMTGLWMFMQI